MPLKVAKTEPTDTSPSSSWSNPLLRARWLYVTFIQSLFGFSPRGRHHWDIDEENTDITVTTETPINPEVLHQRPAIAITRAPVAFFQLGFDDMLQFDFTTGRKTKSLLVPGTMVINCCSRNDLESEYLAWVVGEYLWLLRDLLMKTGFYDVGRNIGIGSPSPAGAIVANDQGDEFYCTAVTSPFHLYRTSEFTPLNQQIATEIGVALHVLPPQLIGKPTVPGTTPDQDPNLPYRVDVARPASAFPQHGTTLPKLPHPLNPAQLVTYRTVGAPLRPPSIGGRRIPISPPAVGHSTPVAGVTINVKV